MGVWLDGAAVAERVKAALVGEVERLAAAGVRPGLGVVLVGDDPASGVYVRSKVKTCAALGMHSEMAHLPASASTAEVLERVEHLNARPDIHGILVQVPLPPRVEARRVLEAIRPEKDVDGLHPENVGRLVGGTALLEPCTPAGIMALLGAYGIPIRGRRAVVVGRSAIVGKPMALLLLNADATVTVCHSKTPDLSAVAREADILVAAVGRPAFVDGSFVRPGAVVVDVGVNRVADAARVRELFGADAAREADLARKGYTLVGDVHAGQVLERASHLTPVPGGVGPLTIAMLMRNTVRAAGAAAGIRVEREAREK